MSKRRSTRLSGAAQNSRTSTKFTDEDELTSTARSPKRRRTMEGSAPSSSYKDLLSVFGARQEPNRRASENMTRNGSEKLRSGKRISYAESISSDVSPNAASGESDFQTPSPGLYESERSVESDTPLSGPAVGPGDEDDDIDEIIEVRQRPFVARDRPQRSKTASKSYATPRKTIQRKSREKSFRLTSDLTTTSTAVSKQNASLTERAKVYLNINIETHPKRNEFLLAHKAYFLPLLPENNYIETLERRIDCARDPQASEPETVNCEPEGVLAKMKPYQLEGLSFLLHMYSNGMSAILGDEMGLGKTLQTLSLFKHLKNNQVQKGENRPCLVVCPLSVLSSWINEAKKWVPNLNVSRFHGPKKEREKLKADCRPGSKFATSLDVMVTTYETFAAESHWLKRVFVWKYCVLDEGHKIKNEKTEAAVALQGLRAEYRLLLTGTPLQNNLLEMWALLHWLYPEVFTLETSQKFKDSFDLSRGKVNTAFMDDARSLLELVMLRRMKNSPGVNLGLPPKEEVLLYVPLTPMQRFWYSRLLTKTDHGLLEELFTGTREQKLKSFPQDSMLDASLGKLDQASPSADAWVESEQIMQEAVENEWTGEWRKLMNLVMQLRKVSSHPYLLPGAGPDPYYIGQHVKAASGKFIVLEKLLGELVIKQGKKVLIFSQFVRTLDLCEDLLTLMGASDTRGSSFKFLRFDGSTERARRNLTIRMFNDPTSEFKVMLISTRAGGLGINLTSATEVVFLDEDWNPQVTLQAEARAHRIGQTKKVTIYKLCTQGTVEEQMMTRIRKKLYLATKITDSMRNIHTAAGSDKKRKRGMTVDSASDAPHLDTNSLKSLIRLGAQTLIRPETDAIEMLEWDWETVLQNCKDRSSESELTQAVGANERELEQEWLSKMEKVETAIFEGKRQHREAEKAAKDNMIEMDRSARRIGKNTTVMMNGYAINKESLLCADWEAVPTLAGKDPRLREPPRVARKKVNNQAFCQTCWDGGDLVMCTGCPRSYHFKCMDKDHQRKSSAFGNFYCSQHSCTDCQAKSADAGGMIYRCRWCEKGYCEDCLDWDAVRLLDSNLPEYEILGSTPVNQAWFIECPSCISDYDTNEEIREFIDGERNRIESEYVAYLADLEMTTDEIGVPRKSPLTPDTMSEVATPKDEVLPLPSKNKKRKMASG